MKTQSAIITVAAISTAALGYAWYKRSGNKEETTFMTTLLHAGVPDQIESTEMDQLENSKMVSEGSQFGVSYFNQTVEDNQAHLDDRLQQ